MNRSLVTTLGNLYAQDVGVILPHEHIFANFAADDHGGASIEAVTAHIVPELGRAREAGITAIVEATAVGGARRPDILKAVSQAANMPIIAATGIFKEPAKTNWATAFSDAGLRDWMIDELTLGIGGSGICAGWIKLSVSDGGLLPHESRLLRAAALASRETDAVIGVHTVRGSVALEQITQLETLGVSPSRFIWIHTQVESDFALHLEAARRGAWIEYDGIDTDCPDADYIDLIMRVLNAGYSDRLLLSHDRVGYNPAQPNGGIIKPYTHLCEQFLPQLRAAGVDESHIRQLTHTNPFNAYARDGRDLLHAR